ncbi:MAG: hypothetical protein AAGA05_09310 [Pseudomonadota bacterium]
MRPGRIAILLASLSTPALAQADPVQEALDGAAAAYARGDLQSAIRDLDFARDALLGMKMQALSTHLPDAPKGWTRAVNTEMADAINRLGGGVGAEAEYYRDDGLARYTITLLADNPMIGSISALVRNAMILGLPVIRVERYRFVNQDGDLSGIVGNQIAVKADGATTEILIEALSTLDFQALAAFGD